MTKAYKALSALKNEELNKQLEELYSELIKLNGQAATGTQLKSPALIKNTKHAIAQIKTLLRERELTTVKESITKKKPVQKKEEKTNG